MLQRDRRIASEFLKAVEGFILELAESDAYQGINVSIEQDERGRFPSLTIRPMVGVKKKVKVRN